MTQQWPNQPWPPQQGPGQGQPPQAFPPQPGYGPPPGEPPLQYPQHGYPPQGYPPQEYPPPGQPPGPYPPQQDPYQRRPVDIDAYAPPKRGGGPWLFVLLAAILAGVVLAAVFLRPSDPGPAPAPTPSQSSAQEQAGPGMPFTMPGATASRGRWEVVSHTWTNDGVVVRVRVTADEGRVTYGFVAFSNAGTEVYEPRSGAPEPEIGSGRLAAGQSVEGNVLLQLPRGPSTLILTTEQGRQMSALPIPG